MKNSFLVGDKRIGEGYSTYFIADIAANHDGDLERAKDLICLAAEAGADAAKFQHFIAHKIVSDYGFRSLEGKLSHQSKWKKSVFGVYEDASIPRMWTETLNQTCEDAGIHFFSAPYDFEAVDLLDDVGCPAHKIGSGDITWTEMIRRIGRSRKPVFMATGASSLVDVERAMDILNECNVPICLMQCNTNYTASLANMRYINLNVLKTYSTLWPDVVLGLSDHTPGCTTVLGAVALGARAIEKHFTDDKGREGPDHKFSMDFNDWREMVKKTRELESALGTTRKYVMDNEKETVILQRRCIRAARDLKKGLIITTDDLDVLRPAPLESLKPYESQLLLGHRLRRDIQLGQHLTIHDVD